MIAVIPVIGFIANGLAFTGGETQVGRAFESVRSAAVLAGTFADDPEMVAAQRIADPSLDHDNPLEEVFEDQLLCADMVVLNKSDLLTDDGKTEARMQIATVLPRGVKIVVTSEGKVDPQLLLGLEAAAEDEIDARKSHHDDEPEHDHDDFESFVLEVGKAPAGTWHYTVTALEAPFDNFPFTVMVAEPAK